MNTELCSAAYDNGQTFSSVAGASDSNSRHYGTAYEMFLILTLTLSVTDLSESSNIRQHSDFIAVVRPRAVAHTTALFVERKILDVHRTRTLVDGTRHPQDASVVVD